ncbi:MAG: sugar ABC transporter ATP-binding protein, partial [Desulfobacteraceae bacterium]|nr:sugar ABC transporter ATP-binding protein [Desulfobacteraceae bacterium]
MPVSEIKETPLILIEHLSKSYATRVLDGVSFELNKGEVHSLVGENGAGKSTLAKIICGLTHPTSGSMFLNGHKYHPVNKKEAYQAGIHMVMQELNMISTLSVAENLFLGKLPCRFGFIDYPSLNRQSEILMKQVGLDDINLERPVGELGIGKQQMIEIAANLSGDCKLLILDEPTAMLTDREVDLLFKQISRLKENGVGIIFISHRLEEVQKISNRISVLRDGEIVGTYQTDKIEINEIVNLMVGRRFEESAVSDNRKTGGVVLKAQSLCRGNSVKNVSFELKEGEILGFAGLVGSGRTETLRLIFGADKKDNGELFLYGANKPVRTDTPKDAVKHGIAMITEDRKEQGLLLDKSIGMNTTLAKIKGVSKFGWINKKKENSVAEYFGNKMSLKSENVHQKVEQLSGGNQQKVILGRWLYPECPILLFDEPTRGIDVGAKFDIYKLIEELAISGKAIIIVSSDLRELMMICDKIAVMSAGKLVDIFSRMNWSQEQILTAAFSEHLVSN